MLNKSASLSTQDHVLHHVVALDLVVKTRTQACAVWLFSTLLLSSKDKFNADSSARLYMYLDRSNFPDSSLSLHVDLTDLLTDWVFSNWLLALDIFVHKISSVCIG